VGRRFGTDSGIGGTPMDAIKMVAMALIAAGVLALVYGGRKP
jgi:hypothetical protein